MARKPTGNKNGRPKGKWSKKSAKERVKFIIEWRRYCKKYPNAKAQKTIQKTKEKFISDWNNKNQKEINSGTVCELTLEAFEKRLRRTFFNQYRNTDAFLIDDELVIDGDLPAPKILMGWVLCPND